MGNNASIKPHPAARNRKHHSSKGAEPPLPPGKPYLTSNQDTSPDSLTIRWDPPRNANKSSVLGYLIEHRRIGTSHWLRSTQLLVNNLQLSLNNLEPGWKYEFRIFAQNAVGLSNASDISDPLLVNLQKSAIAAPVFTQELRDTVALENAKIEFVAYFIGQPTPKIAWYKDGFEIFSSRRTRILTEQDRSILTIHQCAVCDEGEIKCTAINKAGHVSTKAKLTVEAPPAIRLPRQYEEGLLFDMGEIIRLKVSIAGLPAPLVFWSHNGESIQDNERYEIENGDKYSTLRITAAHRTDRGEYQIKSVNKLGCDTASFLITVTDKPSPPEKAKVIMSLGRSVTLSWNTPHDDGGCKVGNYIIEYYRIGWNVWLKAATSKQLTAVLGDLIEGSEYKFRIKAESPFGVSEPSEETDIVVIPTHKIDETDRNKTQIRDILEIPIVSKRRNHSPLSTKSNDEENDLILPSRPKRTKARSPKISPSTSPRDSRKKFDVDNINKDIFDRSYMIRDFTYGTPEIKIRKDEFLFTRETPSSSDLNQTLDQQQDILKPDFNTPNSINLEQETKKSLMENHLEEQKILVKQHSDNMGGSSEFIMVLYLDDNPKDMARKNELNLDSLSIPPPLSLSAPELGTESPILDTIRLSASSTELLHDRAMVRFYKEALAEETLINKKHENQSNNKLGIPKVHINNKENQDLMGLERKHSLRRRLSAGGAIPQQVIRAQRRQSLRSPNDWSDVFDNSLLHRYALTAEEKRELMTHRQRSASEEKEEEEFEKVRAKMGTKITRSAKKTVNILKEDIWSPLEEEEEDEYELSEESDDEWNQLFKAAEKRTGDEESELMRENHLKAKYEEPFEILTKPAKLPDANFIPKPILKKKDVNELQDKQRSNSLLDDYYAIKPFSDFSTKRGSLPYTPLISIEDTNKDTYRAAQLASLTATSIAIPHTLLQQKEESESKVIADHYDDLVRNINHSTRLLHESEGSTLRESLKKIAALQAQKADQEELVKQKLALIDISTPQRSHESLYSDDGNNQTTGLGKQFNTRAESIEDQKVDSLALENDEDEEDLEEEEDIDEEEYEDESDSDSLDTLMQIASNERSVIGNQLDNIEEDNNDWEFSESHTKGRNSHSRSSSISRGTNTVSDDNFYQQFTASTLRKPKLCEIMTQTSTSIDPYAEKSCQTKSEENTLTKQRAETNVRFIISFITNLGLLGIASYFLLFDNELLAIPFIIITVFRPIQAQVKKRMLKMPKRPKLFTFKWPKLNWFKKK